MIKWAWTELERKGKVVNIITMATALTQVEVIAETKRLLSVLEKNIYILFIYVFVYFKKKTRSICS